MSKWLDKALAAVEADSAVSDPASPNVTNANIAIIAKNPPPARSEGNAPQQSPPNSGFGYFGNIDRYGKWQTNGGVYSLPRTWKKAFAALSASICPSYVEPQRWQQLIDDTDRLWGWAPMLLAMGWTLPEVLGRDRLDHLSLVRMIRGKRIAAVTPTGVILRGSNGMTTYIYRTGDGGTS